MRVKERERIQLTFGNAIPSVCFERFLLVNRPHRINLTEARWAQLYHTLLHIWHNVWMWQEKKKKRKSQEATLEWLPRSRASRTWSVGARAGDPKSVLDPLRRQIYWFSTCGVIVLSAALQSEHNFSTDGCWCDGQSLKPSYGVGHQAA